MGAKVRGWVPRFVDGCQSALRLIRSPQLLCLFPSQDPAISLSRVCVSVINEHERNRERARERARERQGRQTDR
jgi:hypothetical protein